MYQESSNNSKSLHSETLLNDNVICFHSAKLVAELKKLPQDWALVGVISKKPYENEWQLYGNTREELAKGIGSKKYNGYGLMTGAISGNIMALDMDGESAYTYFREHISNGAELPPSVAFTSRKPGRFQTLFIVPDEYVGKVRGKTAIATGGTKDHPEQIEFRWEGCQSVLPPSAHPETGSYSWVPGRSFAEVEIAVAPQYIIDVMLQTSKHNTTSDYQPQPIKMPDHQQNELVISCLESMSEATLTDYDRWVKIGMALHSLGDEWLNVWDEYSKKASNYEPGGCEKKWSSFKGSGVGLGTLVYYAKQDGWKGFKPTPINNPDSKKIPDSSPLPKQKPGCKVTSSKDFIEREQLGIDWLFPNYLPSVGTTLLAGSPGVGKSFLSIDVAGSLIFGEPFLGETPKLVGAKVLLITGDEPEGYVREKAITRGLCAAYDQWELMEDWDIKQMPALEQRIQENRPDLIIIDSFSFVCKDESFDENSTKARLPIYELNALTERYKLAVLLIHHVGKSKETKGVNKVRGSSAIPGACSSVWVLSGDETTKVFEVAKIRGAALSTTNFTITYEECRCNLIGARVEELKKEKGSRDKVEYHFVALGCDVMLEMEEIHAAIGGTLPSIRRAVQRLCNEGVLTRLPSPKNRKRVVHHLSFKYAAQLKNTAQQNTEIQSISDLHNCAEQVRMNCADPNNQVRSDEVRSKDENKEQYSPGGATPNNLFDGQVDYVRSNPVRSSAQENAQESAQLQNTDEQSVSASKCAPIAEKGDCANPEKNNCAGEIKNPLFHKWVRVPDHPDPVYVANVQDGVCRLTREHSIGDHVRVEYLKKTYRLDECVECTDGKYGVRNAQIDEIRAIDYEATMSGKKIDMNNFEIVDASDLNFPKNYGDKGGALAASISEHQEPKEEQFTFEEWFFRSNDMSKIFHVTSDKEGELEELFESLRNSGLVIQKCSEVICEKLGCDEATLGKPAVVKQLFRTLQRRWHPDVPGGSEEKSKNLNEGYDLYRMTYGN